MARRCVRVVAAGGRRGRAGRRHARAALRAASAPAHRCGAGFARGDTRARHFRLGNGVGLAGSTRRRVVGAPPLHPERLRVRRRLADGSDIPRRSRSGRRCTQGTSTREPPRVHLAQPSVATPRARAGLRQGSRRPDRGGRLGAGRLDAERRRHPLEGQMARGVHDDQPTPPARGLGRRRGASRGEPRAERGARSATQPERALRGATAGGAARRQRARVPVDEARGAPTARGVAESGHEGRADGRQATGGSGAGGSSKRSGVAHAARPSGRHRRAAELARQARHPLVRGSVVRTWSGRGLADG